MTDQEKDQHHLHSSFIKNKFKVNTKIRYPLPVSWNRQVNIDDVTTLKIYVDEKRSFVARNLNVFSNYVLGFTNMATIEKWRSNCDMTFYQNQLNFAVWCASAGCGVSTQHLNTSHNLLSSVFKFHIYYQVRKILQAMFCPIPEESIFDSTNNNINMIAYKKLCNEFNISADSDFRYKGGNNGGLGTMYNYFPGLGYQPLTNSSYDPSVFQFIDQSTATVIKIDYITQRDGLEGWKQFILEKSHGFTRAWVIRIDDSIRTYVYCVLGSQAQTRSNIMESLECQQNFVDLLELNAKSLFSIPESIAKYQDAITRTNARINYAVGIGLYMIPANLALKVGVVHRYNNNLVIADENTELGENEDINQTTITTTANTKSVGAQKLMRHKHTTARRSPEIAAGASILIFILFLFFSSR